MHNNYKHFSRFVHLVFTLGIIDFREKFHGSYLGIVWAIIRPLVFIGVIWFIFTIGIKPNRTQTGVPFISYLLTGYIVWIFFASGLTNISNSFIANGHLIRQTSFPIFILPISKILSELFIHIIFLLILVALLYLIGIYPSIYWIQLPFYLLLLIFLLYGFGLFIATLRIFTRDISEAIGIILQIGFWATPIFWSIHNVPKQYEWVLYLNPLIFIVNGYRHVFLDHLWFWEDMQFFISYLLFCLLFWLLGVLTYNKLRPHFGDLI